MLTELSFISEHFPKQRVVTLCVRCDDLKKQKVCPYLQTCKHVNCFILVSFSSLVNTTEPPGCDLQGIHSCIEDAALPTLSALGILGNTEHICM